MKCKVVFLTACVSLVASICMAQESYTVEYRKALRDGAKAKMTVAVSSPVIGVVSNAHVSVYFERSDGNQYTISGQTDLAGYFTAVGATRSSVGGSVSKQGYYRSTFRIPFATGQERIDGGRWLPWDPTIPIVLKEIRAPVSMIHSRDDVNIPSFEESLGFDFEKGDWVAPNGKGIVPDMMVSFIPEEKEVPFHKLVVEFPGAMNGAYLQKKDNYSILKSIYRASLEVSYEQRIENANGERGPVHVLLGGDDYLVFRVRSVVDEKGALVAAHYGKIYGPLDYFVMARDKLRLVYYFNPVVNDTNLEFDGKGWGEFWGR